MDRWLIAWIVFSQAAGIAITWWQQRKMTAFTRRSEAERTARHAEEMRRRREGPRDWAPPQDWSDVT